MKENKIKTIVKESYAKVADGENFSCVKGCCGASTAEKISKNIGYSDKELKNVPDGANMGLGCGNPTAIASLKKGETVLDLGCGGGFDCFLAAEKVGKDGKVIGVDMTPQMIEKAIQNAKKSKYNNIEFRLGEIENLPVENDSIDVIISNCVINLSTDKEKTFSEAFRALKKGGRFIIADIVLLKDLPFEIKNSVAAYAGCLSGAVKKEIYLDMIEKAGFSEIKIIDEVSLPIELMANDPTAQAVMKNLNLTYEILKELATSAVSLKVSGKKYGGQVLNLTQ